MCVHVCVHMCVHACACACVHARVRVRVGGGALLCTLHLLCMSETVCCAVIDVETWSCEVPVTYGRPPSPRFGHSSVVYKGKLWIIGGGNGNNLARSGKTVD